MHKARYCDRPLTIGRASVVNFALNDFSKNAEKIAECSLSGLLSELLKPFRSADQRATRAKIRRKENT